MKQHFTKNINGRIKQINIKNRCYYFHNDIINLEDFDGKLLKIDKSRTKTLIFTTLVTLRLTNYERIYSANPLYLRIIHQRWYIEEKNGNKYLIFHSANENKEVLKQCFEIWDGIKNKRKAINDDE